MIGRVVKTHADSLVRLTYWISKDNKTLTQYEGCKRSTNSYYNKCVLITKMAEYCKIYVSCLKKIMSDIDQIREALQVIKLYKVPEKLTTERDYKSNKSIQTVKEICMSLYQDQKNADTLIKIAETVIYIKSLIFTVTSEVKTKYSKKFIYVA